MPNDKPLTTTYLTEPRFVGSWVCFPRRIEGTGASQIMVYHRECCDEDEALALNLWNTLPIYKVRDHAGI